MNTTYRKSRISGWEGLTPIYLTEIPVRADTQGAIARPVLCIHTSRNRNGTISSFAGVEWHSDTSATTALFQDFGKAYNTTKCARVTESAIRSVHEKTLAQIDAIRAEATAQYLNRAEQVTA